LAFKVLFLEDVATDGRIVTASGSVNQDLFWALCGGRGSTFDVVSPVTIRAFHMMSTYAATFAFSSKMPSSTRTGYPP
jgi:FAD/FMN-containing dehydrogenase